MAEVSGPAGEQRPRSREAGRVWTHERIAEHATRLFSERGYDGVSVTEVAREAGVSVGSVYAHYRTKQELFLDVVARRVSNEIETFHASASAVDDLLAGFDHQLTAGADPGAAALTVEFWLFAFRNPEYRDALGGHQRRMAEAAGVVMSQLRPADGEGYLLDENTGSVVLLALFRGLSQMRLVSPESVPPGTFRDAARILLYARDAPDR